MRRRGSDFISAERAPTLFPEKNAQHYHAREGVQGQKSDPEKA